ncbi:MAG: hypothetical protein EPO07_19085 [Verrucomicrobia bacterium]|nr:MAG: hypothetical protein EPO07_19085 [Verrucomicrobiota bacterium]
MKLNQHYSIQLVRRHAAFTLVEVAIALAVIGFALVAIIGVLPTGLEVQKNNREETIIDHDANYFLNAIRNGTRGLDDLTNYVEAITNFWTFYTVDFDATPPTTNFLRAGTDSYTRTNSQVNSYPTPLTTFWLTNGTRIIGLLGRDRYELSGNKATAQLRSNYTAAYVRALSGAATEKFPQTNSAVRDLAFNYRFVTEIVDVQSPTTNTAYGKNLVNNLREVRLLFRWPLLPRGGTGNGREVYRAEFGGRKLQINDPDPLQPQPHPLWFFEPPAYAKAP